MDHLPNDTVIDSSAMTPVGSDDERPEIMPPNTRATPPRWNPLSLSGWGRSTVAAMRAARPERIAELEPAMNGAAADGVLARGAGRGYGDCALNSDGHVILTERLDRILSFDAETGDVVVEPGVTFRDLLDVFLPRGFLTPVSPGTAFATIGGAVANDVHGKNHDVVGSFGDHVRWIDLTIPSGEVVRTSATEREPLFRATIGGVGLTGIIRAVCFRLIRVESNAVHLRRTRIPDLDAYLDAFAEASTGGMDYSVGWIDGFATGRALGRGILEHATPAPAPASIEADATKRRAVPVDLPRFALNPWSVRAFNARYYSRVPVDGQESNVPYGTFLYPLDSVLGWNRIYGKRGFHQFQCVLPRAEGPKGLRVLLEEISSARRASFLAVLKTLGGEGPGHLSFPMAGYTLAMDFPNRSGVDALLDRLERITLDHGGRIYLAKDSRLSAEGFAAMYPKLDDFRRVLADVDPKGRMVSDMARRLKIRSDLA